MVTFLTGVKGRRLYGETALSRIHCIFTWQAPQCHRSDLFISLFASSLAPPIQQDRCRFTKTSRTRLETLAAPLLFESQGIGANATFAERAVAFERLPQGLRKERLFAAGQTIPWFARSAKSSQPIRGILREFAVLFHNCLISYYMSQIFSRTSDQIPHQPLLSFGGLIERNVPSRRRPA